MTSTAPTVQRDVMLTQLISELGVLAVLCGCAHHGPQVQSESAGRAEREQLSWDGVGQRADHRAGTWIWGVFWQWR
jgi:hypothetical protein